MERKKRRIERTNFMEQSNSWAHTFSATQETFNSLWKPTVRYRVCDSPLLVGALSKAVHSTPSQHVSLKSNFVLNSYLCLSHPSGLFNHGSSPKPSIHFPFSNTCNVPHSSQLVDLVACKLFGNTSHEALHYAVLILSFYLLLLRPICLSWHPVLKHTQPVFFFQCERPSVLSNKKHKVIFVSFV